MGGMTRRTRVNIKRGLEEGKDEEEEDVIYRPTSVHLWCIYGDRSSVLDSSTRLEMRLARSSSWIENAYCALCTHNGLQSLQQTVRRVCYVPRQIFLYTADLCEFRFRRFCIDSVYPYFYLTFSFIHSFIMAISIAPLQVLYHSEALPTTARILYRSFTPKRTGNCR